MSRYWSFAIAAALALSVACGRAPDGRERGGGGADGFGDDASPTPAERTGATGDSGRGAMTALSPEDHQFVQKASMSNEMEVTLGNLAEDKAENDRVQDFGEQLARDHEAANRELRSSIGGDATTAGGTRSPNERAGDARMTGNEMAQMQQQMEQTQEKLENLSGQAFDRAYLEEMVKHHQKDVQEFERAAQSDNPQVKAFAERTLPTLREHLTRAQQLQKSIFAQGTPNQDQR